MRLRVPLCRYQLLRRPVSRALTCGLALCVLWLAGCGRVGFGEQRYLAADGGRAGAKATPPVPVDGGKPDAANTSPLDASTPPEIDGASAGADASEAGHGGEPASASGGAGGHSETAGVAAASGGAGTGAAGGGEVDTNQMLGDTGLKVGDVLGYYTGDWGDMILRKQGAEIWGVYAHDGGTIVGAVRSDGVFAGWWTQLPSRTGTNAGEVEFRWTQTGTAIALDGRWRYGTSGEWLENWDIDLVTDRSAPTELSARFDTASDFKPHP